jgi:hypothetical protein
MNALPPVKPKTDVPSLKRMNAMLPYGRPAKKKLRTNSLGDLSQWVRKTPKVEEKKLKMTEPKPIKKPKLEKIVIPTHRHPMLEPAIQPVPAVIFTFCAQPKVCRHD